MKQQHGAKLSNILTAQNLSNHEVRPGHNGAFSAHADISKAQPPCTGYLRPLGTRTSLTAGTENSFITTPSSSCCKGGTVSAVPSAGSRGSTASRLQEPLRT